MTKPPLDWADERSREQIEAALKGGRGSRLLHYQVQLGDSFRHLQERLGGCDGLHHSDSEVTLAVDLYRG